MKVIVVIGTRPEAIKMAPIVHELARYPQQIQSIVCVTGQHREMLDQALSIFQIRPDYDLDLMQAGQTLAGLTARLITALDQVFATEQPDWVLVQGDTTTVMAASLVAFYRQIKIGHVEAGLRSGDKFQPFPEEINRRITDLLADYYFAPTTQSRAALLAEHVPAERVLVTGNTVIDALLSTVERVGQRQFAPPFDTIGDRRMLLVTAHRRENFGEPFQAVCRAIRRIALEFGPALQIVYPVHYNPDVRGPAYQHLSDLPNITMVDPVDYETMVQLLNRADLVLTDSGGLQEEAPSLHKPVLILRDVTERQEVVDLGAAMLVGTDEDRIVAATSELLTNPARYAAMSLVPNPYGDGQASRRIVQALLADQA
ncbi:MAG: UDP-N-acetylglucosamine 2-epimerase (non-hydrolyzing) [Roseiflexaceae bacterium]